ncbi:MAG: HAMP domain-containing histidine kinase [Sphingomonadales bacterium]|nr:HAMP domain-containing histidine kinase [Sphingomonadales bacterium]MDE2170111.1 HAMP domain-containing histidine kinase [Sphingomonadales bacterium]
MIDKVRTLRLADLRHTTAFRLTAGLCSVFVVAVVGLLGLTYVLTAQQLFWRTDQVLDHRMEGLILTQREDERRAIRRSIEAMTNPLEYTALYDRQGYRLEGNVKVAGPFPLNHPFDREDGGPPGVPLRLLARRMASGDVVIVARDISPLRDLHERVLTIMGLSGLVTILAALVAGVGLSLGPMRRVQHMQVMAAAIARGDLRRRLPDTHRRDEIDVIGIIINGMVEEIERLMGQVKGATDAIAHDMRTPLTHLRARLDRLAQHDTIASDPALRESMYGAIGELDAALARFRALLRISEIEASHRHAAFQTLDPQDVLTGVAELYDPLAEERGITLHVPAVTGLTIRCDERLMFEAISNLVENAIKFAPENSTVTLALRALPDEVVIEVSDSGPGILEDERERVLRRFERGAAAALAPGSGLGLSLVVAIVQLHGFEFSLDDAGPGLIARIIAPRLR